MLFLFSFYFDQNFLVAAVFSSCCLRISLFLKCFLIFTLLPYLKCFLIFTLLQPHVSYKKPVSRPHKTPIIDTSPLDRIARNLPA